MMRFGLCCCCKDGSVKDRWLNTTKVRPNDDGGTPGAPHYTCDPFARFIEGIKESPSHEDDLSWCEDQTGCAGCGSWLAGADMNGYSAQDTDIVDKIMACGSEDATHTQLDHNCYEKSGTVDMRVSGRRGGRWVLGKKFWHGAFGIIDRNDATPRIDFAFTGGTISGGAGFGAWVTEFQRVAPQVKYRTHTKTSRVVQKSQSISGGAITTQMDYTHTGTATVYQLTGLQSKSGSRTGFDDVNWPGYPAHFIPAPAIWDRLDYDWDSIFAYFRALTMVEPVAFPNSYVTISRTDSSATVQLWSGTYDYDGIITAPDFLIETLSIATTLGGGFSRTTWKQYSDDSGATFKQFKLSYETANVTNTSMSLSTTTWNWAAFLYGTNEWNESTGDVQYTDPYTSGDVKIDFYAALRAWNLASGNLHYISAGRNWRRDEALALAPLVIYDEVQSAVSPSASFNPDSDDYEQDQDAEDAYGRNVGDPDYIPTWHKRGYIDPAGQMWEGPDGTRFLHTDGLADTVAGSTLLPSMRKGWIIAAGIEGGERLFWFNADNYERLYDSDAGDPAWHWNQISKGALSDTRLPEATRRWMNLDEAQYDAVAYRGVSVPPPSGNYPQSFLRQQNGALVGAKYVEATQSWPAVNFDYPCGDAKWDVDQTTVCCLVSGNAATGFRVKKTGNASSTPAAGQKILVDGDGIYEVSAVTSHGGTPAEWTLTVGAKVESIASGRSCLPVGMDALGLYSDGATHIGALRWWVTTPTDCPTNTLSNRTGVKLAWTFNARLARLDTADQPLWLGGTTAGDGTGIVGCTSLNMAEFTFGGGSCPAVVGWVPFYSQIPNPTAIPNPAARPPSPEPVENFTNQTLFAMPDVFDFDDTYGALWMGAVEMVMPDPFWQDPFKPDCAIDYTEVPQSEFLQWHEDNGSGAVDYDVEGGSEENPTITHHAYFPHRRWVAARCTIPAGKSLPSGVELFYATGSAISPADGTNVHYDSVSGGIVLGGTDGSYRSIERPWGFTDRACTVDNRFGDFYETFTNCP